MRGDTRLLHITINTLFRYSDVVLIPNVTYRSLASQFSGAETHFVQPHSRRGAWRWTSTRRRCRSEIHDIYRDAAGLYGHRYGQQLHIERRPAQYLPHISDTWNCCRKRRQASRTFTAESLPCSDFLLLPLLSGRLYTASALLPPCGDDHLNKWHLPNLIISL